ncbi:MAG: histidinol dehydrogenase, partial [Kiloniellales bacterium]
MPHRLDARRPDFEAKFETFLNIKRAAEAQVEREVAEILTQVRDHGDSALIEYSARFDRIALSPETLRVPEAALAEATARCSEETL